MFYSLLALDKVLNVGKYIYAIIRGNWNLKGYSAMFDYLYETRQLVNVSGKILSNQPDQRGEVHAPRLKNVFETLQENEITLFNNMLSELFTTASGTDLSKVIIYYLFCHKH